MKLSLGISPCPNDTFMFDAMINGKIDTEGLFFDVLIADVEELNKKALSKSLHIAKISYHAFIYLINDYVLLDSGSAMGRGCGPLLISRSLMNTSGLRTSKVAIPGKYTTANFLLNIYAPELKDKVEIIFSEIEDAILSSEVDAGVIIHENRFTYASKGLLKIIDLGEFWTELTPLPLPLGGIVVNRNLSTSIQKKINRVLRRSVEFALKNPKESYTFIRKHAQEMDEKVLYKHIELYVNNYSLDLGVDGKNAVKYMFKKAIDLSMISELKENIFLTKTQ